MITQSLAYALVQLRWTPQDFWCATPTELALALAEWRKLTQAGADLGADAYRELSALRARALQPETIRL